MLDKINNNLIKVLNEFCEPDAYKIIDVSELIDKLKNFKLDNNSVITNLKYLQDRGYLDIKYSDETSVCLCILPKARGYVDDFEESNKIKNNSIKYMLITAIISGICAFLGGFIAFLIFK